MFTKLTDVVFKESNNSEVLKKTNIDGKFVKCPKLL